MTRRYELKRRAEAMAETRLRITEAAVALHGSVGPARTTITAVAARAGVERLTVYRHFPDEAALFRACTGHWLDRNPFPDPGAWASVGAGEPRLRAGLGELYAWYGRTEAMMANFLRDGPLVPALAERLDQWSAYLESAQGVLAAGWDVPARARPAVLAAVGHALDFETWRSLRRHGLADEAAAELMSALARLAAAGAARRESSVRRLEFDVQAG